MSASDFLKGWSLSRMETKSQSKQSKERVPKGKLGSIRYTAWFYLQNLIIWYIVKEWME